MSDGNRVAIMQEMHRLIMEGGLNAVSQMTEKETMNVYQKGLAAGIVLPLQRKLIANMDNLEQWLGDLEEEAVDGMVSLEDVQKRVEYFVKLMHANVDEATDRVK